MKIYESDIHHESYITRVVIPSLPPTFVRFWEAVALEKFFVTYLFRKTVLILEIFELHYRIAMKLNLRRYS